MNDPYKILDISRNASYAEIEAAYYKKRAMILAISEETEAEAALQEVEAAFQTLQKLRACDTRTSLAPNLPLTPASPRVSTLNTLANVDLTLTTFSGRACKRCGIVNPYQAERCQACFEFLTKECPHCGHKIDVAQTICDRCQTVVNEYQQKIKSYPTHVGKRVDTEREIAEEYAREVGAVADALHRRKFI